MTDFLIYLMTALSGIAVVLTVWSSFHMRREVNRIAVLTAVMLLVVAAVVYLVSRSWVETVIDTALFMMSAAAVAIIGGMVAGRIKRRERKEAE